MDNMEETLARLKKMAEEARAAREAKATAPAAVKLSLADILAAQQKAAEAKKAPMVEVPTVASIKKAYNQINLVGSVAWNERQQLGINYAQQGKSFCLIGAAGTGKTTTLKGCIQTKLANELIPMLRSGTKQLLRETPGIALVSYTRRAVRQIARQLPPDLSRHAMTIHKLLEFEPVFYEMVQPDGSIKRTRRFEPMRHSGNPLPAELTTIFVDESSMVASDLFEMLRDAAPRNCQFIFLGDMHQLPPVYGDSILAAKLQELPVVELTEVYRQALDSPIISLATDIKNGIPIPLTVKRKMESPDGKSSVTINPWPKQLHEEDAMDMLAHTIKNLVNSGNFNEEEDVVLMPHNVGLGTLELNLHFANALGLQRKAVVHHVIAGFMHWYLAEGDRVLVDKQDCVIRKVERNPKYSGKIPLEASDTLDRWGTYQDDKEHHHLEETNEDIDEMLQRMADAEVEDKQNQASHVITIESLDTGNTWRVGEVGIFAGMVFSYALTVHKSQGSEWRRVFVFLHTKHHAMCSRELVYTAVTRARETLIIICEPDRRGSDGTLTKAAKNPRIKGNTLAEKLEWLRLRSLERMAAGKKGEDDELFGK